MTYLSVIDGSFMQCQNCKSWDRNQKVHKSMEFARCLSNCPEIRFDIGHLILMCEDDHCIDESQFSPTKEFLDKFPSVKEALKKAARKQAECVKERQREDKDKAELSNS